MDSNVFTEIPEQRLTQDLMRISSQLKCGLLDDHTLAALFDSLITYSREIGCEQNPLAVQAQQFSKPAAGSSDNEQLSKLMVILHNVQAHLRNQVLNLAERLEMNGTVRQATACYGGVVHREHASQALHTFRYQS